MEGVSPPVRCRRHAGRRAWRPFMHALPHRALLQPRPRRDSTAVLVLMLADEHVKMQNARVAQARAGRRARRRSCRVGFPALAGLALRGAALCSRPALKEIPPLSALRTSRARGGKKYGRTGTTNSLLAGSSQPSTTVQMQAAPCQFPLSFHIPFSSPHSVENLEVPCLMRPRR